MTEFARFIVVLLLSVTWTVVRAASCDVPDEDRRPLMHHLAWSDFWLNTEYLKGEEAYFHVVKRGGRRVWLVRSSWRPEGEIPRLTESDFNMVFLQYLDGPDSGLRGAACEIDSRESWIRCLETQLVEREGGSTLTDALLGGGSNRLVTRRLSREEISDCVMPAIEAEAWQSSPDSPRKRALIAKIRGEVQKQATFWGQLQRAFSNNFNVDDPNIYSVADVRTDQGEEKRIFISMRLSSRNEGSCSTWRVDDQEAAVQQMFAKIVLHGLLNVGP